MLNRQKIKQMIEAYFSSYPDEKNHSVRLLSFLEKPHDYFNRKNFNGHITASGIVLSADKSKTLLIGHRFLKTYLQPGGHVESGESIVENALREIKEETGIPALALRLIGQVNYPLDINIHPIPANPKKDEAPHYHFDFRYPFIQIHDTPLAAQEDEVFDLRWFPLNDAMVIGALGQACLKKLQSLIF